MGDRIVVDTARMREVAGQFRQAGQEAAQLLSRIQSTMNGLQGDWEGASKERFFQEFLQWQKNMKPFVDSLNEIDRELNVTAERFDLANGRG